MITYNHELFVAQAIEGILNQQTDFDIEVIIADDASTDSTQKVIEHLLKEHPSGRKVMYVRNERNLGVMSNFIQALKRCSGKYIALCEGDDFWIGASKLQKQVDYLEANPQVAVCLHNGFIQENGRIVGKSRGESFAVYSRKHVIKSRVLAPTASYCFRNQIQYPDWMLSVYGGDTALLFLLSGIGEIHYLPDIMCTYRKNPESLEGKFLGRPLEKAKRDIGEYKIYLSLVDKRDQPLLIKRIIWCYFYRVAKGLQLLQMKDIVNDISNFIYFSFCFILLKTERRKI
jgi:glycosyltransferase involved in cell wall biosynthesis